MREMNHANYHNFLILQLQSEARFCWQNGASFGQIQLLNFEFENKQKFHEFFHDFFRNKNWNLEFCARKKNLVKMKGVANFHENRKML